MNEINSFIESVYATLPFVGVAVTGATLQSLKGRWRGWKNFLLSNATAGFGAFLVGIAFQDLGLSQGWAFMLAGMIGYSGGSLMDEVLGVAKQRINRAAGVKDER